MTTQKILNKLLGLIGYKALPTYDFLPSDIADDKLFVSLYNQVRPFTMTSAERLYALYQTVRYIVSKGIDGDFVECGVWKGGSCMMMALTLQSLGAGGRKIYLYDTFEGMSEPTDKDKMLGGQTADKLLKAADKSNPYSIWCASGIDEVRQNLLSIGMPSEMFILTKGKVEETIPGVLPGKIALLRLDTDWYESTLHELNHLYPLLEVDGALIIDDFGFWEGAKKAVLEYFEERPVMMHRIDDTGRCIIKPR